jgi:hypothetical protein
VQSRNPINSTTDNNTERCSLKGAKDEKKQLYQPLSQQAIQDNLN